MRCRASGWPDSPHSFTAADRAAGHRHDLSILQAEFSVTQMLDTPISGRIFLEQVIRDNSTSAAPIRSVSSSTPVRSAAALARHRDGSVPG
jgi:hypothetical protein